MRGRSRSEAMREGEEHRGIMEKRMTEEKRVGAQKKEMPEILRNERLERYGGRRGISLSGVSEKTEARGAVPRRARHRGVYRPVETSFGHVLWGWDQGGNLGRNQSNKWFKCGQVTEDSIGTSLRCLCSRRKRPQGAVSPENILISHIRIDIQGGVCSLSCRVACSKMGQCVKTGLREIVPHSE